MEIEITNGFLQRRKTGHFQQKACCKCVKQQDYTCNLPPGLVHIVFCVSHRGANKRIIGLLNVRAKIRGKENIEQKNVEQGIIRGTL